MSRVIIGPYREGLSLKELFTKSPGGGEYYEDDNRFDDTFVQLDSKAVSSSVFLTEDWAERQNDWDSDYKGIIVTENDLKYWENDHPLRHTSFALETKKSFIAGPDSIEEEDNAIDIARGKVIIGVLDPVKDATTKELKEAVAAINAKDSKHIVVMSEDREMMMPRILKHASVWDSYRDLPLVQECFEEGEAFPGKRVNELQNAVGGALNLLSLMQDATEEMRSKGHYVPDTHTAYVSYFIKFLEYDESQSLPEEGIFITASEKGRRFLPVLQKHIDMEKAGIVEFDLNDFDVPADYYGLVDDKQEPITIETLRSDPHSRYFSHQFASARAMRSFVEVMNIPILDKPREHIMEDIPDARLNSNLNFGEFAHEFEYGETIGSYLRAPDANRIYSHKDIENGLLNGDGTVVEKYNIQAPAGVNQDLYELEQKLVARIIIADRATVKPLAEPSALGRPLIINHDIRSQEMPSYHNAVKFRTITARSDHVFRGFSDIGSFMSVMAEGQWDKEHMKPIPEYKDYDLIDEIDLLDIVGRSDIGFTEAFLGSASSHLKSGNSDAIFYTKETSKKTITMTHGGGGRFIMGKFFEGAVQAMKEGNSKFLSLAMRVPLASRKEGSLKPLLRKHDLDIDVGDFDRDYMSFGDEKFHVLTFDNIGERQHAILAPAHVVTSFIGGVGTDYEYDMAMYHNLMVEMRGFGIFPGFDNEEKKRIHFVNSKVMNGGNVEFGFYDALKESLTEEQWEILNVHFYDTPEQALEARNKHAAELGYDIDSPRSAYSAELDHDRPEI